MVFMYVIVLGVAGSVVANIIDLMDNEVIE